MEDDEDGIGMGHNEGPPMDDEGWAEQQAKRQALLQLDEKTIMERARKATLVNLLQMVEDGLATAQDMSVLRALLKDNGMVMGDPFEGSKKNDSGTTQEPQKQPLPDFPEPDYDP